MAWTNGPIELYHGTLQVHAASIRLNGINPARGAAQTDFGRGFYCTTNRQQASDWADALAQSGGTPEVLMLKCDLDVIAQQEVLAFVLDNTASQFRNLVAHCRATPASAPGPVPDHGRGAAKSYYDVVIGPVVAWPQRGLYKDYDQISFHGTNSISALTVLP
jgi:hypothetical protein